MNSVERVKEMCKVKGIALSKLEKDLGYANGYISGLRKGTLPDDRLRSIAEYLKTSVSYLSSGETQPSEDPEIMVLAYIKSKCKPEFNALMDFVLRLYEISHPDDTYFKEEISCLLPVRNAAAP